jgi:YbbR domain-containing protein
VTVNVYNATNRTGLAAITASQLRSRGFKIGQITNDPLHEAITASAQVRGSASQLARLQFIGAQVGGTTQAFDHRTNETVDLVLGNGYRQLRSPAQVTVAINADAAMDAKAAVKPICR